MDSTSATTARTNNRSAMPQSMWFVFYTKPRHEKTIAATLMGKEEVYVAIRKETHIWSDRKKQVEVVLVPHTIFIRTTDIHRRELLRSTWGLLGCMMDCARNKPAIVPDAQMQAFQLAVSQDAYEIEIIQTDDYKIGDTVTITEGIMAGKQGNIIKIHNKDHIGIGIPGYRPLIFKSSEIGYTRITHSTPLCP